MEEKCRLKLERAEKKSADIDRHRRETHKKIDSFFQDIIEAAKRRAEDLKYEFDMVEKQEKRKLESKKHKVAADLQEMKQYQ
jgi:hypothetical protein